MKSSFAIGLLSAVAAAALISTTAPAQSIRNHNSNAPVTVDAGASELLDRVDRAAFFGGVTIQQAGLTIKASRVNLAYTSGNGIDIDRVDAIGGVIITKDDLRATSNSAIYDLDSKLITLIGGVNLAQGANRLSGGRLVIDLNSGRSTLGGGGTPGVTNSGGRVKGTFTVPQRNN
jgi:lipopolysaccharide export system protein LptA